MKIEEKVLIGFVILSGLMIWATLTLADADLTPCKLYYDEPSTPYDMIECEVEENRYIIILEYPNGSIETDMHWRYDKE